MSIEMKDIPLVSKYPWWCVRVGGKVRKARDDDEFRTHLKAAHLKAEQAKQLYGEESKAYAKAKKDLDYYMKQIDEDQSDMFTLHMFNTDEWIP